MSLIFNRSTQQALERAMAACRVHAKQRKIPIAFARSLKTIAPDGALQFLGLVPFGPTTFQSLALGLELDLDPSVLRTLVPATPEGFSLLGEFASSRGMPGLAAQVYESLGVKLPRLELCRRYLAARQPSFVTPLLGSVSRTSEEAFLLAKACLDTANHADSLRLSQWLWAS